MTLTNFNQPGSFDKWVFTGTSPYSTNYTWQMVSNGFYSTNPLAVTLSSCSITVLHFQFQSPLPSTYTAWAAAITNGLTNYNQCATGDGYPNLLKYATGSSPTHQDSLAKMGGVIIGGHFWMTFNRNTNATDVTLVVETTTNLTVKSSGWVGVASNIHNGGWVPSSLVREIWATNPVTTGVKDNSGLPTGFMRLQVTSP